MATAPRANAKADLATFFGVAIACLGIVGGLMLEGGRMKDIMQITAALIVVGGTFGAVLVNTPLPVVKGAARRFRQVLFDQTRSPDSLIEEIIGYAARARKNGLVSLEGEAQKIRDPFLRKALNLGVDGADLQEIRKMMDLQIEIEERHALAEARVFESAGGYSPTIGIIGAVLGLIQVMKNLANIEEVGRGIAVAFVATVYGVALANIFLLPIANKMKARIQQETQVKELILEGVAGIVEGLNPKLIRSKLEAYRSNATAGKETAAAKQPAGQPAKAPAAAAAPTVELQG